MLLFISQNIGLSSLSDKGLCTIHLSEDSFTIPVRQRIMWLYTIPLSKDSVLSQSDKGFSTIPLTKGFFIIPIRRRMFDYSSQKGFRYYPSLTKNSVIFLSQRISLIFQSFKGFFTTPLTKGLFAIPIRQRIIYFSSHKIVRYYSSPTKDLFIFWGNDKKMLS